MGKEIMHKLCGKRIAHIAGAMTTGGVEAIIYNYFSRMNRADYELVYVSYSTPDPAVQKRFGELGFQVYVVTKKRENLLKSCKEVYGIFKKHDINIVHSHMTLICFVTSIIGWLCGIKVRIAHSHLAQKHQFVKRPFFWVCKLLTRLSSTDYAACGKEAALYLFGNRAYKHGKVTVLHNALEISKFAYNPQWRESARARYTIGEKLCVGHVGRFTEQKNHAFLLDVFKALHAQNPGSVLILAGNGPLMQDIIAKVKEYGLQDDVIFAGACGNVNELYQAMDVFLLPSLYEGLPVVMLEAQIAGLPIFVSKTVTNEIAFSESVHYLPLELGSEGWAKEIDNMAQSTNRSAAFQNLSLAEYDVNRAAQRLDAFYSSKTAGSE